MEIDRAVLTELSKDEVVQAPRLDGVFSMEDFMGDYEANRAALKAEKSASNAFKRSAPSKSTPKPAPGPIAIGARSSKYKVAVHDKCQKLGIPNAFYEATGDAGSGFSGVVSFPGSNLDELNFKDEARYPSKTEAYEAVSKFAFEALEKAEQEGRLARFGRVKGPAHQTPKEKEEPGPNYVGQLLGTCESHQILST
jgi:hypothetical protein